MLGTANTLRGKRRAALVATAGFLAVSAALVGKVAADLPIHCLHCQAVGVWELKASAPTNDKFQSCGWSMPGDSMDPFRTGNARSTFAKPDFTVDPKQTVHVRLEGPNLATVVTTNHEGGWVSCVSYLLVFLSLSQTRRGAMRRTRPNGSERGPWCTTREWKFASLP